MGPEEGGQHVLGLPDAIRVCLFDLDGVLTDTASVHSAAWKQTFDELLQRRDGDGFRPFSQDDYDDYVDGKPRADGVRDFLSSATDPPAGGRARRPAGRADGQRRRQSQERIAAARRSTTTACASTRDRCATCRPRGTPGCGGSSSRPARTPPTCCRSPGWPSTSRARSTAIPLREQHIKGKPAPDSFLAGAALAGVEPRAGGGLRGRGRRRRGRPRRRIRLRGRGQPDRRPTMPSELESARRVGRRRRSRPNCWIARDRRRRGIRSSRGSCARSAVDLTMLAPGRVAVRPVQRAHRRARQPRRG